MAWTYNAPVSGDTAYVTTLTNCVTELHTAVDGKSPLAGPGTAQAFTVGALSATTVNTIPISTGAGGVTSNTAVGVGALTANTTGLQNTANGVSALQNNTTGSYNTANGVSAGTLTSAGTNNATSSSSVYLGYATLPLADGDTNEIVIGASAIGNGSNTVTLGNSSITTTILRGNVGIGTTAPQGKIDIFSAVNAGTTPLLSIRSNFSAVVGNYGMIRFGDQSQTTNYQKGAIIYEGVSASARGRFHIALNNDDTATSVALTDARLTVLSNGNVGIGTTAPTSILQVVGLPIYANNAAAITGGLTAGAFYRTGADPDPVMVVH